MKEKQSSKRNTSRGAFLDAGVMGGYKSNFAGRTGKNAPPELAPQRYVPKEKRNNVENKD